MQTVLKGSLCFYSFILDILLSTHATPSRTHAFSKLNSATTFLPNSKEI